MIATSGIFRTLIPADIGANIWTGDNTIKDIRSLEIRQHYSDYDQLIRRCSHDDDDNN